MDIFSHCFLSISISVCHCLFIISLSFNFCFISIFFLSNVLPTKLYTVLIVCTYNTHKFVYIYFNDIIIDSVAVAVAMPLLLSLALCLECRTQQHVCAGAEWRFKRCLWHLSSGLESVRLTTNQPLRLNTILNTV